MQGIRGLGAAAIFSIAANGAFSTSAAMVAPRMEFPQAANDGETPVEPDRPALTGPVPAGVNTAEVPGRRPNATQICEAKRLLESGEERFQAGDTAEAARLFTGALGHLENLADAHARLALIHLRSGRVGDGVKACERALELDPTRVGLYRILGLLYAQAESPDAAIECLAIVRSLEGLQPEALKLLAMLNVAAARPADAVEPFEAYLAANPRDADTWVRVADLYAKSGDGKRMTASLERALESDPSNQDIRYRLALAYAQQGEAAEALHHLLAFVKAERGEPGLPATVEPGLMRELSRQLAQALAGDEATADAPISSAGSEKAGTGRPDEPAPERTGTPWGGSEAVNRLPSADLPDRGIVEKIIEAGQAILPIDPSARYVFYVFSQEEHRRKIARAAGLADGDEPLCVAAISSKIIPATDAQVVVNSMVTEAERHGCRGRPVSSDVVAGLVELGERRTAVAALLLTKAEAGAQRAEGRGAW